MYVEAKEGDVDGARARIGGHLFEAGKSVRYCGRLLLRAGGQGALGNYVNEASGAEFWVSEVKRKGSNAHSRQRVAVTIDEDAAEAYRAQRALRD